MRGVVPVVILPRKMSASTSAAEFEIVYAGHVECRHDRAQHGGNVDKLYLGGGEHSSVMGMSDAPKSTVPL